MNHYGDEYRIQLVLEAKLSASIKSVAERHRRPVELLLGWVQYYDLEIHFDSLHMRNDD